MRIYQNRTFPGNKFQFYLRRSTYVHVGLFLIILFGGKIVLDEQKKLRDSNIELISASVRVDLVEMPKYTLNELKNLSSGVEDAKKEELANDVKKSEPEKVEVKAEEKADDTPSFEEANKKKRDDFLSKLKKIGNKKIKSEGKQIAEKGLYGNKASELKQLVLSGNKLNKGTALFGDANEGDMSAFHIYTSKLPDLVRGNWQLPSFLADRNLKARIRIYLSANGELLRAEVYQSSGEPEYDQRAIEAVKSTSPFPALDREYEKYGRSGNIILGFPL